MHSPFLRSSLVGWHAACGAWAGFRASGGASSRRGCSPSQNWADLVFDLSAGVRLGVLAAAAAAGPAPGSGASRRVSRQRALPAVLARRLDAIAAARGEIDAGVDLLDDTRTSSRSRGGSRRSRSSAPLRSRSACPGGAWLRCGPRGYPAGLAGCLASGLAALVALLVPRVGQSVWLRFSDPFGDHPPYSAVLLRVEPGDVRVLTARVSRSGAVRAHGRPLGARPRARRRNA